MKLKLYLLDDTLGSVPGLTGHGILVAAGVESRARKLAAVQQTEEAVNDPKISKICKIDFTATGNLDSDYNNVPGPTKETWEDAECIEIGEAPPKFSTEGVILSGNLCNQ